MVDTQTPAPATALSLAPCSTHIGAGQTSSEVLLFLEDSSWLAVMAFPEVKASQKHRVRVTFETGACQDEVTMVLFQLKELVLGLWTRHRLRIVLGIHLLLISWATLGRWSHMVKRISNFLSYITL